MLFVITYFYCWKSFFVFIAVNLALNPLNSDVVFDGDMTTHRSISAATVNLNGMFIVNAFIIHTSIKKIKSLPNIKKKYCTPALIIYNYDISGWFNGSVTVRDGHQNVLLNDNFQLVSPTIVLPRPVLTDILNMQFSTYIEIREIEVFGGKL